MKNFKFSLQKLLDIRKREEEQASQMLGEKLGELLIKDNELKELIKDKEREETRYSYATLIEKKIIVNYLYSIKIKIEEKRKEINILTKNIDKLREDLIQKQINRKTVESLKEKKELEFNITLNKKEQNEIDEFALNKFIKEEGEENND